MKTSRHVTSKIKTLLHKDLGLWFLTCPVCKGRMCVEQLQVFLISCCDKLLDCNLQGKSFLQSWPARGCVAARYPQTGCVRGAAPVSALSELGTKITIGLQLCTLEDGPR